MDPVSMVNEVKGPRSIVPRRRTINIRSSTPSQTQETHEEGKERPIKNLPANAGDVRDMGLIPGLERSPGEDTATHSSILA